MIDEESRNKNCLKRRGRNDVQNKKTGKEKKNKDKKDTLYKTTCCKQSHWPRLLQSTQNTKDMTIHTGISEIIG